MKEEFIILLEKFIRKDISTEELKRFHYLYEKLDVDEKLLSDHYRKEWDKVLDTDTGQDSKQEEEIIWEVLQRHIKPKPFARLNGWQGNWQTVAAAVIIAVLCTGLGYFASFSATNNEKDLIVRVERGQKAQVELPDGSVVWLNAASKLSYTAGFNKKDRVVSLIGEACFEVEKNPKKAFIVQTADGLAIKALGTKFNVKSYPEDESTISTLLEGKIQISDGRFSEILKPNEKLIFSRKDSTFSKKEVKEQAAATSWINNRLVFEEETLGSIANMLKRLYHVEVIVKSDSLSHILYSGKIKNNNLDNVLELITTVSPVQYTLKDNVVTFQEKSHKPQ